MPSFFCRCGGPESGRIGAVGIPQKVDFNLHVRPILSDRCFKCHGPDDRARKAGFRLDQEAFAFAALDSADQIFAVVPGAPEKSELYARISSTDPREMMPPPASNLKLTAREIGILRKWIEQGAEWKAHWSFIQPQKVPLPEVQQVKWPRNEIDYFILAQIEGVELEPAPEAIPEKLLRRLHFDLTGLPPSPEEVNNFKSSDAPRSL